MEVAEYGRWRSNSNRRAKSWRTWAAIVSVGLIPIPTAVVIDSRTLQSTPASGSHNHLSPLIHDRTRLM
jgi:hypothetical protein